MFFQVYGEHAFAQWGMLIVVLLGLILLNEFARRTKLGGCITFLAVPLALTIGPRKGSYPGMLAERDFTVTLPGHAPVTVHYTGRQVQAKP